MEELQEAIKGGHMRQVIQALSEGVDPNSVDAQGISLVHSAAVSGHWQMVRELLDQGANVNAVTSTLRSPLHFACGQNYVNLVRYLLVRSANPDLADRKGSTALHMAARYGHNGVVNLLLTEGANINVQDKSGSTALHVAVHAAHLDAVRTLLRGGVDPSLRTLEGKTASEMAKTSEVAACFNNRVEQTLERVQLLTRSAKQRSRCEASVRQQAEAQMAQLGELIVAEREVARDTELFVQERQLAAAREKVACTALEKELQAQKEGLEAQNNGDWWCVPVEEVATAPEMLLGAGQSSQVWVGLWGQTDVALRQFNWTAGKTMEHATHFCEAVEMLCELSHPHLLLTLGAVVDGPDAPILVSELLQQSLAAELQAQNRQAAPLVKVAKQAKEIALGLRYLHSKEHVHSCLSSRKVMLDIDGKCKLSFLPEVIRAPMQTVEAESSHCMENDIFDLGIIIIELARGELMHELSFDAVQEALEDIPWQRLRSVVGKCVARVPGDRPTARALIDMLKFLEQ